MAEQIDNVESNKEPSQENVQAWKVIDTILDFVGQSVVGQKDLRENIMIAFLSKQHILVEGAPGLAKTLTINRFSQAFSLQTQRIQFTPDLLPSDLVGTLIFNPKEGSFTTKKGPIFHAIILADEINRAPAKVQSALLEAMQERQVTIDDTTYPLPEPFMVLATQNPIEQEGTYPLPEAQVDRFMMQINVNYPTAEEELEILNRYALPYEMNDKSPEISYEQIQQLWTQLKTVYVSDSIKEYIVSLVQATRDPLHYNLELDHLIRFGCSPRATLALTQAAQAHAFLHKQDYVAPHNVRAVLHAVFRHRIILHFEAKAENLSTDDIIDSIVENLPLNT